MLLAICFAALWLAENLWVARPAHSRTITAYLFVMTIALEYYLMRLQRTHPAKFVVFIPAAMAVKLAGHVVFMLVLALTDSSAIFYDAVYFISLYMVCTVIGVITLYRGAGN
ncbi:MAG: hypothetical protein KatS3mg032_2083 [Cyclobacteriaceae bacterium]|nr:MAG: hypothetical protein KatS3mg032_2083 [Cyclobacteriaceae bacterium]